MSKSWVCLLVTAMLTVSFFTQAQEKLEKQNLSELYDEQELYGCFGVNIDVSYLRNLFRKVMHTRKPVVAKDNNQKLLNSIYKRIGHAINKNRGLFGSEAERMIFSMNIAAFIQRTFDMESSKSGYKRFLKNKSRMIVEYKDHPLTNERSVYVVTAIKCEKGKGVGFAKTLNLYEGEFVVHPDLLVSDEACSLDSQSCQKN